MQQPNDQTNEQKLSQLMDGEWHELNPSECVAALCEDECLRGKWSRYHMIRYAMKSEPVAADHDLASRISAAIEHEPAYTNITPFNAGRSVDQNAGQTARQNLDTSLDIFSDAEQGADLMKGHSAPSIRGYESFEHRADSKSDSTVTSFAPVSSLAKKNSMFKTGLTGFAMAASVALVTVVGMNIWQSQSTDQISSVASAGTTQENMNASAGTTQEMLNASAGTTQGMLNASASASASQKSPIPGNNTFPQQGVGTSLPVVEFVSNTGSYWVSPETTERVADEQRLNMMMSQHFENSPTADREGLLPYSRLVGYDELSTER